jgi:DNA-binding NarL/FixJ family response regulator
MIIRFFREGLKVSLSQDDNLHFLLEADNGEDLLKAIESSNRCYYYGSEDAIMDGMEATQLVRKKYPGIKFS